MTPGDALFNAMTGNRKLPSDVAGLVKLLGGTRQAAASMGVQQRSVQRWITGTAAQRRKPPSAERVREAARSSPIVRARMMTPTRAGWMRKQGARIQVTGVQGPGRAEYATRRAVGGMSSIHPDGATFAPVVDAFLAGNDEAAVAALNAAIGHAYMHDSGAGWHLESVDRMGLSR